MNSIESSCQSFLPLVREHICSFLDNQSLNCIRLVCKEWNDSSESHFKKFVDQAVAKLGINNMNHQNLNKKIKTLNFDKKVKNLKEEEEIEIKKVKTKTNSSFLKQAYLNRSLICEFGSYVVIAINSTSYQIFNSLTSDLVCTIDDKILISFNETKTSEQKMTFQALNDELFIVCYNQAFIVRQALTGKALFIANSLPDLYHVHFYNNQLFYINQNFQLVGYDLNTCTYLNIKSDPTFFLPNEIIRSQGDNTQFFIWGTSSGHLQYFDLSSKKIIQSQNIKLETDHFNFLMLKKIDDSLFVVKHLMRQSSIVQASALYEMISLETGKITKSNPIDLIAPICFHHANHSSNNFMFIDNKLFYVNSITPNNTTITIVDGLKKDEALKQYFLVSK